MKRILYVLLICMLGLLCAGCKDDETPNDGREVVLRYNGEDIYTDEAYIYLETVKESYESKYGADVWKSGIETEDGISVDPVDAVRREAIAKLVKTKTLITKSEEYGISLTATEETKEDKRAQDFYDILTDEQINACKLELDTVKRVLKENALAEKIYSYIMKQSSTEISDEQARMSTFFDMFFECYQEDEYGNISLYPKSRIDSQKKAAENAYASIIAETDNPNLNIAFLGSAKELKYAGTHTMSRDEIISVYGQETLDILYSLENGQISQIVETEYGYHIFQMLNITDEKATQENKEKLTLMADSEYYENLMAEWIEELDSGYSYAKRVDMDVYEKLAFEASEENDEKNNSEE